MSMFLLYCVFVFLPNLSGAINPLLFLAFIIGLVLVPLYCISNYCGAKDSDAAKVAAACRPYKTFVLWAICILILLQIIVPTNQQMMTVAGAYVVTNNAELKQLPENVLKAANSYLGKLNESLEEKAK